MIAPVIGALMISIYFGAKGLDIESYSIAWLANGIRFMCAVPAGTTYIIQLREHTPLEKWIFVYTYLVSEVVGWLAALIITIVD